MCIEMNNNSYGIIKMSQRSTTRRARRRNSGYTHKHIKRIYGGMTGYMNDTSAYDSKFALTYGEVTLDGVKQLAHIFQRHPITTYPVSRRVFYDLGSGIGKNVIMMASLVPSIISKGIELVNERHNMAMTAYRNIKEQSVRSRVEFIHGSILDRSLSDAAWIYISNLCFSSEINDQLSEKLGRELQVRALIVCSKPLNHPSLRLIGQTKLSQTWSSESEAYVYEKIL
jgi:hypothetical protein